MEYNDPAGEVREGEELDAAAVHQFLLERVPGLKGEIVIQQFLGGHSNLTYLVKIGEKEMILRRPPFGTKPKTGHDMHREFKVLSALNPVFKYAPKPLAYTDDTSIIGCPFYVMERVLGYVLRRDPPEWLKISPEQARRLAFRHIEVLHELHSLDYKAVGLGDLGNPDGYCRRQVEGWCERYRRARTPDVPDCEDHMKYFLENIPAESNLIGIVHNDFRFDNLVLNPNDVTDILGVLDWEMCTVGDQMLDIGCTVAYWVQKDDPSEIDKMRQTSTTLEGMPTRRELVDYYRELSGSKLENFNYYYIFSVFRLLVILQQIYYRYYHGQTKDERFKIFGLGANLIEERIRWAMDNIDL